MNLAVMYVVCGSYREIELSTPKRHKFWKGFLHCTTVGIRVQACSFVLWTGCTALYAE